MGKKEMPTELGGENSLNASTDQFIKFLEILISRKFVWKEKSHLKLFVTKYNN